MDCRAHIGLQNILCFSILHFSELLLLILAVSCAMHFILSVVLLSLLCPKANAELDLESVRTATVKEIIERAGFNAYARPTDVPLAGQQSALNNLSEMNCSYT